MPTVTTTADLPAAPERVWAVLTDPERYSEWNTLHTGFPDGPPAGFEVGTKYREQVTLMGMPGEATWTVTEVEQPNKLVFEGEGPMGIRLGQVVELTASGDSTQASIEASFEGGPLAGPIGESLGKSAEQAADASLGKLAALVG